MKSSGSEKMTKEFDYHKMRKKELSNYSLSSLDYYSFQKRNIDLLSRFYPVPICEHGKMIIIHG